MAHSMASSGWWIRPLETYATVGMAANFGITTAASMVTVPLFMNPNIPAKYVTQQFLAFAKNTERIAPINNALCVLTFIVLSVTSYRSGTVPTDKLRFLLTAIGLGVATTAYARTIMVPMNTKVKEFDQKLQNGADEKGEVENAFRSLLPEWRKWNTGRMILMGATAACSAYTLALQGSVASY